MNGNGFARLIGDMDDPFAAGRANKRPRRMLPRVLAAAAALALVVGVLVFTRSRSLHKEIHYAKGYEFMENNTVPADAVLPPERTGWPMSLSYLKGYDFESAYAEAPYICIVTIGNWLMENDYCTYYEATVDRQFKGSLPEKIVVYQIGSTKNPSETIPYRYGDTLLLYLSEWENTETENAYAIVGADICALYLAADNDGNVYYIDVKALMSIEAESNGTRIPENGSSSAEMRRKVSGLLCNEELAKTVLSDTYIYIYPAEGVEKLFEDFE